MNSVEYNILEKLQVITGQKLDKNDYLEIIETTNRHNKKDVKFIDNKKLNKMGLFIYRYMLNSHKFYQKFNDRYLEEFKNNGYIVVRNALSEFKKEVILNKKKLVVADTKIVSLLNNVLGVSNKNYKFSLELLKYTGNYDNQTNLHTDKPRPTIKCWLYIDDIDDRHGSFQYVKGSNMPNNNLLKFYYDVSNMDYKNPDIRNHIGNKKDKPPTHLGSIRVHNNNVRMENEILNNLGYEKPISFNYPENTLIIADTIGLHKRGNILPGYVRRMLTCNMYSAKINNT